MKRQCDYPFYEPTWEPEKLEKLNNDIQDVVDYVKSKSATPPNGKWRVAEPIECQWCSEWCHPDIISYHVIRANDCSNHIYYSGYYCDGCYELAQMAGEAIDHDNT